MRYLFLLALSLVFVVSSGCGATQTRDLGIPVEKAEGFYFHMKEAALNAGYNVNSHEQDGHIVVYTPEGTLTYQANRNGDGLSVTLMTKDHDDKNVEAQWLDRLEQIHEELINTARAMSKKNQAW